MKDCYMENAESIKGSILRKVENNIVLSVEDIIEMMVYKAQKAINRAYKNAIKNDYKLETFQVLLGKRIGGYEKIYQTIKVKDCYDLQDAIEQVSYTIRNGDGSWCEDEGVIKEYEQKYKLYQKVVSEDYFNFYIIKHHCQLMFCSVVRKISDSEGK